MFVPGATIPGERYLPLMEAVQALYPGALWVAATTDWNNDRWGAGRAANEPSRSLKFHNHREGHSIIRHYKVDVKLFC